MKKDIKSRLALAGAEAVLSWASESYQINSVPVPKRGEKDFEKTFVSPYGFFSPLRLDGKTYWELTPKNREEAIRGAEVVRREHKKGKSISMFLIEESASDETDMDMDYFHNLTVGYDGVRNSDDLIVGDDNFDAGRVSEKRTIKDRRF
jgi:hypothetical protein